ncbi:MAG: cyclic-di-AMP receptor [Armatimonadota bacterium]|nr:cyclic-di-AMP receptor [Armatimonadota bacterium]MDR7448537.1 cyclic-di-AMP receptor [Armatimonadota bacterium]MDR7460230.1 cyclic-di-AMP receptor [Armatimonadota bacterium]MDR7478950.1 cyclic-di-AMP receptor [Armatimonadota bacterium]MDR7488348.1 cyclic-di-AMP receptor [Armatimonadota bacterium]
MKLVLAVVQERDAGKLMDGLTAAEFQATMLASTGGFLREGNTTILIGVDDRQVDEVLAIIRKTCHRREQLLTPIPPVVEPVDSYVAYPVKVEVGGAIVFVLTVDRMERI